MAINQRVWDPEEIEKRTKKARDVLPPNVRGLLPAPIAAAVETIAKEQGVSPFQLLGPLLTSAAFAMGCKSFAKPGQGFAHTVAVKFWSVVVGYSGSRKSAAYNAIRGVVKKAAARVELLTGETTSWFHRSKTMSHLRDHLGELKNPKILILAEELGTFNSTIGLHNKDATFDRNCFILLMDGSKWEDSSRSRPDDPLKDHEHTGVEGTGYWQPDQMGKFFSNADNLGSGLTYRWNFFVPDSRDYEFKDLKSERLEKGKKKAPEFSEEEEEQLEFDSQVSPRSAKRARVAALLDSDPRDNETAVDEDESDLTDPYVLLAETIAHIYLAHHRKGDLTARTCEYTLDEKARAQYGAHFDRVAALRRDCEERLISAKAGMLTKDPGKLLALATILQVLNESCAAVRNGEAYGQRVNNVCEEWSITMAAQIVRICNLQRLTLFAELQLLCLLDPDTYASQGWENEGGYAAAEGGRPAVPLKKLDEDETPLRTIVDKYLHERYLPATVINRMNVTKPQGMARTKEMLKYLEVESDGVLGEYHEVHPRVEMSNGEMQKGSFFVKRIPETAEEALAAGKAMLKYNLVLADFWRPALALLADQPPGTLLARPMHRPQRSETIHRAPQLRLSNLLTFQLTPNLTMRTQA